MQPIDVRAQVRLPPTRIFGLCLKGIRHRLLRSLLTTTVIVLAVAFFMNLLADSVIARAVDVGIRAEVRELRLPTLVNDRWFSRPSAATLSIRLASDQAAPAAYAAVSGWNVERVSALSAACRREHTLVSWLDRLDSGKRAMLIRRTRNDQVLSWLADQTRWREFATLAARVRSPPLPLTIEQVRAAVEAAPATAVELDAFTAAWRAAVEALASDLRILTGADDPERWLAWLAEAGEPELGQFAAALATHGFDRFSEAENLPALQSALRELRLREAVASTLLSVAGRERWLATFRNQPPLEERLLALDDPRAMAVTAGAFTADELQRVRQAFIRERKLTARETALIGKVDPHGGLVSTRQAFLVGISFLVCMVGIANAMLMAITERFREIATMKCLGATDGFILALFLIEAGIQGAAGGAVGTVVGMLLSLSKGGWLFGSHLLIYLPWLGLALAGLACVFAGLLLATLASIYPSWMASRMAPMEAMRVE